MNQEQGTTQSLKEIIKQLEQIQIKQTEETRATNEQLRLANQNNLVLEQKLVEQKRYHSSYKLETISLYDIIEKHLQDNERYKEKLQLLKDTFVDKKPNGQESDLVQPVITKKQRSKDQKSFLSDDKLIMYTLKGFNEIFETIDQKGQQIQFNLIESTDSDDKIPKLKKSKTNTDKKQNEKQSEKVHHRQVSQKEQNKQEAKHNVNNAKKTIQVQDEFKLNDCRVNQVVNKQQLNQKNIVITTENNKSNTRKQQYNKPNKVESKLDKRLNKDSNRGRGEIKLKDCRNNNKQNEQTNLSGQLQQEEQQDFITNDVEFSDSSDEAQQVPALNSQMIQSPLNEELDEQSEGEQDSEGFEDEKSQSPQVGLQSFDQARQSGTRTRGGKSRNLQDDRSKQQEQKSSIIQNSQGNDFDDNVINVKDSDNEADQDQIDQVKLQSFEQARQSGTRTRGGKSMVVKSDHNRETFKILKDKQTKVIEKQKDLEQDSNEENNQDQVQPTSQVHEQTFSQARQNGTRTRGGKCAVIQNRENLRQQDEQSEIINVPQRVQLNEQLTENQDQDEDDQTQIQQVKLQTFQEARQGGTRTRGGKGQNSQAQPKE